VNLNSELMNIFGPLEHEKIKFNQLMGLMKPHLTDCGPLELFATIRRGMERER